MEQIVIRAAPEIKLQPKNVFNLPPDPSHLSSLSGPPDIIPARLGTTVSTTEVSLFLISQ
jgi:hypothetical protein